MSELGVKLVEQPYIIVDFGSGQASTLYLRIHSREETRRCITLAFQKEGAGSRRNAHH